MVSTFFPPWRGGVEVYAYNVVKQLLRFGHEVTVLCANSPYIGQSKLSEYCPMDDVDLYRLKPCFMVYGVPITPALPTRLMKLDVDVLHVNFPNPYNAYVGSYVSRLRRVPSVLTWHNDLPHMTSIVGVLARIHDSAISYTYLQHYRRIIATSEVYFRSSSVLQRYREKVRVIPNGVDCERFNPGISGEKVRSLHKLEGLKIILFVGALTRWHRYKGLDILIKAFHRISNKRRDVKLLVVGKGSLREEYQLLCSQLSLTDRVVFAGDVSDEDLPKYYAASDLLVLPSRDRSEGFGLTLLEANACGRPVIGSGVGGIPGVIRYGVNGLLVPPRNAEALAEAILRLVEDDDLRVALGKSAREWAILHDWSVVADATEALYLEILGDSTD